MHRFTAVRRGVISFVEASPRQQCGEGWTYDHSLVFPTITSEVDILYTPLIIFYILIVKGVTNCPLHSPNS